jgi:butyryl-CoA dehydrogenase
MGEMGFLGSFIPETYGGAGLDILSYVLLVEEVSKACGSSGILISAHSSLACDPILRFGSEAQKQAYLPDLATGNKIGCLLLTEPDAGTDVSSLVSTYRRDGGDYVINGSKIFVTNGGCLGTAVLLATGDRSLRHKGISAFIVDLTSRGISVLRDESKMGIRGTHTTAFAIDDLRLTADNLLGAEGQGFKIAMETLNGGRIGVAAQALGIAEGAFARALAYAQERTQFGKPLCRLQAVQFKLADMHVRIETSRLATYHAAWLKEGKKSYSTEAAIAKLHSSETAAFVTREAIQIHGGYGYCVEYEVERMCRDARITEIYEGTSEAQRMVIAKALVP